MRNQRHLLAREPTCWAWTPQDRRLLRAHSADNMEPLPAPAVPKGLSSGDSGRPARRGPDRMLETGAHPLPSSEQPRPAFLHGLFPECLLCAGSRERGPQPGTTQNSSSEPRGRAGGGSEEGPASLRT